MGWTRADASHLLLRAGMGGSIHQVETLYALGRCGAIEYLLDIEDPADPAWPAQPWIGGDAAIPLQQQEVALLVQRLLESRHPLRARMTWFWLDHFAPAMRMAGAASLDAQTRALWRQATGPYKGFLPALYREGVINGPLTGAAAATSDQALMRRWPARLQLASQGGAVVAERAVGANGSASEASSTEVVRRLFDRPDTMLEVCACILRAFVSPFPDAAEMARLSEAWRHSGGRIGEVMRALLRGQCFWDARVRGGLSKGPLEFAAGLVQRLDLAVDRALARTITEGLMRAGHWLAGDAGDRDRAPVAPRSDGRALMDRYAFARHAVFGIDAPRVAESVTAGMPRRQAPQTFITALSARLGIAGLGVQSRALVSDHLGQGDVCGTQQERVLEALYLLVCSPEYQRC